MFLEKTIRRNRPLIEAGFQFHQTGAILPDSYLIDVDTFKENARNIWNQANSQNIKLYFMLKQVGRNPYLAKELIKIGYEGAVVVDFREAMVMMKHHIPISNVGHLVQPPQHMLQILVDYGCEYFTVFSIEKIKAIHDCAKKAHKVQKLLLKVAGKDDIMYSGQHAGFQLESLKAVVEEVKHLKYVEIQGVTSFPCFLYDEITDGILPTSNFNTLQSAKAILKECGITIENVNAPSTTSIETLKQMANYDIQSGEPGHGMSGSTPLHAKKDCVEIPAVIYVSEISHNFDHAAYCYGGGFYRRSHMKKALVGKSIDTAQIVAVDAPDLESIDYYFGLSKTCSINDTVIMAFRFQIFVTRSNVVLIEGLSQHQPVIIGSYTSLGEELT